MCLDVLRLKKNFWKKVLTKWNECVIIRVQKKKGNSIMAYNKKSAHKCVEDKDFYGCWENFVHTTPQWKDHWWKSVVAIYNAVEDLQNKLELDYENRTYQVKKAKRVKRNKTDENPNVVYKRFRDGRNPIPMVKKSDCAENIQNEQVVYFFKFYDKEGILLFNKIGTTSRDAYQRLRDEIKTYSEKFDIGHADIHRIVRCNGLPAEGPESALRAEFIRRYPESFHKNDRFFDVDIDPLDFDQIVNRWLE
jgi:translation elongation factor P/translation initiation factor 5A